MKGSYTILVELTAEEKIEVGSIGEIDFSKGVYAYNGSAFGPGGLKRIDRHLDKSQEGGSPYWHIDYLLVLENAEIVEVFKQADSDHECSLSQKMRHEFDSVEYFGCSDCSCSSHLFYSEDGSLRDFLQRYYSE